MRGLATATIFLTPAWALSRADGPGRRALALVTDMPPGSPVPDFPHAHIASEDDIMPHLPGFDSDEEALNSKNNEVPDTLGVELAQLDALLEYESEIEEMIVLQELRLAERYGWTSNTIETECYGLKCLVGKILLKVSEAVLSLYDTLVRVEDMKEGPDHGSNHGKEQGGNHTHGNHPFPHPPPWWRRRHRLPHHHPHFCRCPPPRPLHEGHPSPPDKPPHRKPHNEDCPSATPVSHGGEAPWNEASPSAAPQQHTHLPLTVKLAAALTILAVIAVVHRRLGSCLARREARRRRRAARKEFLKHLLLGGWLVGGWRHRRSSHSPSAWFKRRFCGTKARFSTLFDGREAETEQKEAGKEGMLNYTEGLRDEEELDEKTGSVGDEIAACRRAAEVVGDMVAAAEEGRAVADQTDRVMCGCGLPIPHYSSPSVNARRAGDDDDDGDVLPAYDERLDGSVADGLRYTPSLSVRTPSSGGNDQIGDGKH